MPARRHTLEQLRESVRMVQECGGNQSKAAAKMGIPRSTLQSRCREAQTRQDEIDRPETVEERQAVPKGMPFDRAWQTWLEYIGAAQDRYQGPAKPRQKGNRERVVACGDLHIPYHRKDALAELITHEAHQTDVLIIGGDFGDGQAVSTHMKYELVPYEVEQAEKTLVLQALSEAFPKVIYLRGSNHSDRVEKRIRENLPKDVIAAIMDMTGGVLNPDVAMVKRFPNISLGSWETANGIPMGWLAMYGDALFSHAEVFSSVPGTALRTIAERVENHKHTWALPEVRGIFQFHTHAQALFPWRADMLLCEPGCMAETMGYQSAAKGAKTSQRVGYAVMEFEDGRLDFDSVQLRFR